MSDFFKGFDDFKLPQKLSKNELKKLFKEFHDGSKDAKDKIIMHSIRLVIYRVYGKFGNFNYDKDDLISIGQIGLMKAVDTYDINKGFDFSTYAISCIDNEINMFIRRQQNKVFVDSLDRVVYHDDKDVRLIDLLESDIDLEEEYIDKEKRIIVKDIVESLSEQQREVIKLYFGFYDRVYRQPEIAKMMGVSQSKVSRLIRIILNQIKIRFNTIGYEISNSNVVKNNK